MNKNNWIPLKIKKKKIESFRQKLYFPQIPPYTDPLLYIIQSFRNTIKQHFTKYVGYVMFAAKVGHWIPTEIYVGCTSNFTTLLPLFSSVVSCYQWHRFGPDTKPLYLNLIPSYIHVFFTLRRVICPRNYETSIGVQHPQGNKCNAMWHGVV